MFYATSERILNTEINAIVKAIGGLCVIDRNNAKFGIPDEGNLRRPWCFAPTLLQEFLLLNPNSMWILSGTCR